jgi:hypothetical protein
MDLVTEVLKEQLSDIGSLPTFADNVVQELSGYLTEDRLQMTNFDILNTGSCVLQAFQDSRDWLECFTSCHRHS